MEEQNSEKKFKLTAKQREANRERVAAWRAKQIIKRSPEELELMAKCPDLTGQMSLAEFNLLPADQRALQSELELCLELNIHFDADPCVRSEKTWKALMKKTAEETGLTIAAIEAQIQDDWDKGETSHWPNIRG